MNAGKPADNQPRWYFNVRLPDVGNARAVLRLAEPEVVVGPQPVVAPTPERQPAELMTAAHRRWTSVSMPHHLRWEPGGIVQQKHRQVQSNRTETSVFTGPAPYRRASVVHMCSQASGVGLHASPGGALRWLVGDFLRDHPLAPTEQASTPTARLSNSPGWSMWLCPHGDSLGCRPGFRLTVDQPGHVASVCRTVV